MYDTSYTWETKGGFDVKELDQIKFVYNWEIATG